MIKKKIVVASSNKGKIAEIKEIDVETVLKTTTETAIRQFDLNIEF